jgi:NADP-dependent 3-hydroxy acid dehydrogenase YdfG
MNKNNIKDKILMVTGASRGMGRYFCKFFADKGAKIAAIARNEKDLKVLKDEISNNGSRIDYFPLSVTDYDKIQEAVEKIVKKWGTIDILINNAGVIKASANFDEYSKEDMNTEIDTNLKGTLYVTRLVSPIMIKNRKGYIFNISSVGGTRGPYMPGAEVYIATKFGINGFSDAYSKYLLKHNVHLITLCPGGTDTTIWDRNNYRHGTDKEILIKPIEIAQIIEHVLSVRSAVFFKSIVFFPTCEADEW